MLTFAGVPGGNGDISYCFFLAAGAAFNSFLLGDTCEKGGGTCCI